MRYEKSKVFTKHTNQNLYHKFKNIWHIFHLKLLINLKILQNQNRIQCYWHHKQSIKQYQLKSLLKQYIPFFSIGLPWPRFWRNLVLFKKWVIKVVYCELIKFDVIKRNICCEQLRINKCHHCCRLYSFEKSIIFDHIEGPKCDDKMKKLKKRVTATNKLKSLL